jgi:DNA repair protein RecN (Recombination protein N)
MLRSLRIQNIVLVDDIEIDFQEGFCAITGETGAGKSIILNCLNLIRGNTASIALIRKDQNIATITAVFSINYNLNNPLIQALKQLSIECSGELIIRRILDSSGKNKVYINDIRVSLEILKNITNDLFEINSQREQYSILDTAKHRNLLDNYAENGELLAQLLNIYTSITTTSKDLQKTIELKNIGEKEKAFLEFVVKELEDLNIKEGEENDLTDTRIQLKNLKNRDSLITQIIDDLNNSDIERILFDVQKLIFNNKNLFVQYQNQQNNIKPSIEKAIDEIVKIKEEFQSIIEDSLDETNLGNIEERLFALKDASNKYNTPIDKLCNYLSECRLKLGSLSKYDESIKEFNQKLSELQSSYYKISELLSDSRKKAALTMEKKIMKELAYLKLDKAVFKINVETDKSQANINSFGQDKVSFIASMNPGQSFSLLNKIASGGELSRLMLAIKVVLANQKDTATLIFDEIDSGIGGATADAVGKRLKDLSTTNQLLVVTHHPQVASKANMHILVKKDNEKNATSVSIDMLNIQERRQEIARMLSGSEITKEALAAADNLLIK